MKFAPFIIPRNQKQATPESFKAVTEWKVNSQRFLLAQSNRNKSSKVYVGIEFNALTLWDIPPQGH